MTHSLKVILIYLTLAPLFFSFFFLKIIFPFGKLPSDWLHLVNRRFDQQVGVVSVNLR